MVFADIDDNMFFGGGNVYQISSRVLDPQKLEKDFTFCGIFDLKDVDKCVVKYLLKSRGCTFDRPSGVTFDGIISYVSPSGGEEIYVKKLA